MVSISGTLHNGIEYKFIPENIAGPERITGQIQLSPVVEPDKIDAGKLIEILDTDWKTGNIQIRLDAGEKTKDGIHFTYAGETSYLPMLSAPVLYVVSQACSPDPHIAEEVIKQCYTGTKVGWELRDDCRDILQFEAFVEVLDALSEFSEDFGYVQFRSAAGYFAKRIQDDSIQAIDSFDTLKTRIRRWNAAENLEDIRVAEVIGEKLGREWIRSGLSTERQELLQFGFDPIIFDPEWDTVVPACWIAHTLLTDGVEAAKDYVHERPNATKRDYHSIKSSAKNADFGDQGSAWGNVVALTANTSNDDFQYDVYNYLLWSGKEYRGKAKFEALLFAGARKIIPKYLPAYLEQEANFKEHYVTGHAWRRDLAFENEKEAFKTAKRIAEGKTKSEYEFKPDLVIEAESSLANAEARLLNKSHEQNLRYNKAIAKISELSKRYDVSNKLVTKEINFLNRKRVE